MLGGAAAGAVASCAVVRATEPHFLRVRCRSGRTLPTIVTQGEDAICDVELRPAKPQHEHPAGVEAPCRAQCESPGACRCPRVPRPWSPLNRPPVSFRKQFSPASTQGAAPSRSCDLATTDLGNSGPSPARAWCGLRLSGGADTPRHNAYPLWNRALQWRISR